MVIAAVATGAFVAAAQSVSTPPTSHENVSHVAADRLLTASGIQDPSRSGRLLGRGGQPPAPGVLPIVPAGDGDDLDDLAKGARMAAERAAAEAARMAAEEAARHPAVVSPTNGIVTSSFGPRWGSTHYGLDIANDIGTPILAVMDGVVLDSGPASGFGLWVRLRHDDGTITVYGHIDRTLVEEGQRVSAGEQIADMGNRGFSTGPHLHFEVHSSDGEKLSPEGWLDERAAMAGIVA